MTMEPSVVSGVDCSFGDSADQRVEVELVARRLQRDDHATQRDDDKPSPFDYLTTLRTLQELGVDPMDVLDGYWREVATGDAYMAMALHLESQDRLLSRGSDSALLNAIRSIESLYAAQNPGAAVERVAVQKKVDDAVFSAGDVGTQILDAWPELHKIGKLRRYVAHGRGRPSARLRPSMPRRSNGTAMDPTAPTAHGTWHQRKDGPLDHHKQPSVPMGSQGAAELERCARGATGAVT